MSVGYYLLLLFCCILFGNGDSSILSIVRTSPWQYELVDGIHPQSVMSSSYNNSINQTGWSQLEITGQPDVVNDDEMAYMAGYLEGAHTSELIYMSYTNMLGDYCTNSAVLCEKVNDLLDKNLEFMKLSIANATQSEYWYQVHLYLKQLEGLEKGYYSNTNVPKLPKYAFQYLQFAIDLENFKNILSNGEDGEELHPEVFGSGSCSAIIKVLPNNADLLTSHDTWSEYQSMLRVYKLYNLPYKTFNGSKYTVASSKISFSSYPGKLQSEDDFYIMSSGLVTQETTNGVMEPSLWNYLTPNSVFEPIRVMVSNRLATDGNSWSTIFSMFNSGTYNNQWMIVDYNKFTPYQELPNSDILWVLEQIPGTIIYHDQTEVLKSKSYWASYNIPYYPEIFQKSGFTKAVEQYGNFFSHENAPRALIFARDHVKVNNIESLFNLMRYNDFKNDPLSKCNCTPPYSGENAISARSDLNPPDGTYPIAALGHRYHGGTDNKIASAEMVKSLSCLATSGPTHKQQPVFSWSTSGYSSIPLGHPDTFDFTPVHMKWSLL